MLWCKYRAFQTHSWQKERSLKVSYILKETAEGFSCNMYTQSVQTA